MTNIIISVKDLVKNYGSFHAVKGISFDVYEGEIFGLLGPNGAGKSTTLEIMETLRSKTSGAVKVAEFDLDKQPNEIKKNYWCSIADEWFLSQFKFAAVDRFVCRFI